jgi:serine/threonine protein kinase
MLRSREALALGGKGRYRLLRQISEDPIGSLWLAKDVAGVEVSVRILRKDLGANERFRRLLRAELRRVWPLKHPHVANVISYSDVEGHSDFFVLRALEGESLAHRLRREGRLDPSEAATIASQVETALDAAHTIGIVHGILTAHSVLLTPADGAKVIDFGIPTALVLAARDAPRLALDASKDRGVDLAFDASHDARGLEVLTRMMLGGTERNPDGKLPILIDRVLAARSDAAVPRHRSVREVLRLRSKDRGRGSPRIVAPGSKPRSRRMARSHPSRHRRSVMKGISSSATAIWRARSVSGRPIKASPARATTAPAEHPGGIKAPMLAGATLVAIIAATAAITLFDGSRSTIVRGDRFETPTASARGIVPSPATGVIMPDVRQLTAMQASERLSRAGLVVVDAKPMAGPAGEVVGTDPAPRLLVAPGAEVVLLVGASPDRVEEES